MNPQGVGTANAVAEIKIQFMSDYVIGLREFINVNLPGFTGSNFSASKDTTATRTNGSLTQSVNFVTSWDPATTTLALQLDVGTQPIPPGFLVSIAVPSSLGKKCKVR